MAFDHKFQFSCNHSIINVIDLSFRFTCKQVGTDLVQEQCEADADTSIQQRLLMGAATTVQGTGGTLCEEGEDNQDMMIAGGMSMNVHTELSLN